MEKVRKPKRVYYESDNQLLLRLNPFVNNLFAMGAMISLVGGFFVMLASDSMGIFVFLDLLIAAVCGGIYFYRNRIAPKHKLLVLNVILFVYGLIAFQLSGIYGSGLFLSLTALLLSLVFLNRIWALGIGIVSSLHAFTVLYFVGKGQFDYIGMEEGPGFMVSAYVLVFFGVFILMMAASISIKAIKVHLYENIHALKNQMAVLKSNNDLLEEKNREIEYLAYYNPLTTLQNRTLFTNNVNDSLKNYQGDGTLVLMDLVAFHKVNAFYGMEVGDKILHNLGVGLKEELKHAEYIGYMGNNTIAIWLDFRLDNEAIQRRFARYKRRIIDRLNIDYSLDAYVVGVARTEVMKNFSDIFNIADKGMKHLKRGGKKNFMFFDKEGSGILEEYESNLDRIKEALELETYQVFYQEKVNSVTGKTVGLEALARLIDDQGTIPPSVFVPIIEENNLARTFGEMILKKVLKDMPRLTEIFGQDLCVSINVSPQEFGDNLFIPHLHKALIRYGVAPQNIELEITENILLTDIDKVAMLLKRLKGLGLRISIDDFGTGYSSLKYVSELPIDVIKVDKSFIDRIEDDKKTMAIVKAIVDIAHATGIHIVAEGVESMDQVKCLRDLNCHIVQGYIYSKPCSLEMLLEKAESTAIH